MELLDRLSAALGKGFSVERELGRGGMSRVFVARDASLNREVVVKVLPPELVVGVSVERFKREIQIAASLQHPNIVPLLTAGAVDSSPYYLMPFVRGQSLRERLDRGGAAAIKEALSILRDVARALAYAHRHGVAHRDVKPENILLTDGVAVVADFGIAKALSAAGHANQSGTLTGTGMSIGTPAYMAPEQAAGDGDTDHRADIYAFGCVAYELLAGKPPFEGRTPRELLAAHMAEVPRPIQTVRDDTPANLSLLIARCLEKDPAARPQSAEELTRELEASLSDSGGLAASLAGEPQRIKRALAAYSVTALGVVGAASWAVRNTEAPDWVLPGAVLIAALGLPLIAVTTAARLTARRALAPSSGSSPQRSWDAWVAVAVRASRHLRWRRLGVGGAVVLGAFAALVVAYMVMRAAGVGPVGSLLAAGRLEPMGTILVADFASAADDTTLARLATESVRIALQQSSVARVMAPEAAADALRRMRREPNERVTAAIALEMARREGMRAIVVGELTRGDDERLLTTRLVATDSGNTLASASAVVAGAEGLIEAADKVSRKLRSRIGESLKRVRATPELARVTTASLVALDKYTQGAYANSQLDFPKAAALLKEAVEIDTAFASAWRMLGHAYFNGRLAPGHVIADANARAYRHRERLSDRERLLAEAVQPGADRARRIAAYERLVELYPRDREGLNQLANWLLQRREFARSESLYRRLFVEWTDSPLPYRGFLESLMRQRKYRDADSVVEAAARRFPGPTAMWRAEVKCARATRDDCETILRAVRDSGNASTKAAATMMLSKLAAIHGELTLARRLHEQAAVFSGTPPGQVRRNKTVILAYHDAWTYRRPERAAARLDSLPEPPAALGLSFWARDYAHVGAADRAREMLKKVERLTSDSATRTDGQMRFNTEIARAWTALADRRWRDAINEFMAFDAGPDGPAHGRSKWLPFQLAVTYDRMQLPDSAVAMYERYVTDPQFTRWDYDVFWLAHAHERLSELHEQLGNREKGAEYAEKFIELWKNADPELQPRVAEARRRLARLRPLEIAPPRPEQS